MKMRLIGKSLSNRHYEALFKVEGRFDSREILRTVKRSAEEINYFVKYFARKEEPFVFVKYASESWSGADNACIFVRNTAYSDIKRLVINNKGFDKKKLEDFADLILINLGVENLNLQFNQAQPESQLCQSEQLGLFQPG